MAQLANMDSLAPDDAARLAQAGLATTEDVLVRARKRSDRAEICATTGTEPANLDRLAAMADLMRISGLSEPHAQLLIALETPTAAVLATRKAPILVKQIRRKNVELLLARAIPPESTVARWIDEARTLPPGADL